MSKVQNNSRANHEHNTTAHLDSNEQKPWYIIPGQEEDVIISSRLRVSRNLSDFMYPHKLVVEEKDRIKSLLIEAINFENDKKINFDFVDVTQLSDQGKMILMERNILSMEDCHALFISETGNFFCRVNETDHVKLAGYKSGLNFQALFEELYFIDEKMQEKVQYAANFNFGYINSSINNTGTGLKSSFWCYIPSIVFSKSLAEIEKIVLEKNMILRPAVQNKYKHDFPIALFEVSNINCQKGTEFDQMAEILGIASLILKTERKIREQLADNSRTVILNFVKQAYAKCAYSLLLEYNEALSIISAIKFGLQGKFLTGVEENTLNSMIYKLKQNHLDCLTQSYDFEFENDLKNNKILQIQRLRAVILQETIEKIQFTC